jgi:hypothetical protein
MKSSLATAQRRFGGLAKAFDFGRRFALIVA